MIRASHYEAPPLALVAPFFLLAPVGAIAAGLIALRAGDEIFVAINTPRMVAITHALVLGWITATMMGATYQLGPVVLGGELRSWRLGSVQLAVHVTAVGAFVWSVYGWDVTAMSWAGALLITSFVLFIVNTGGAVWGTPRRSLTGRYLATSLVFLALAGAFGITWVGTLEHHWFPVTLGKLAAHAHLGLVGWLGLTLMGVSYQLVPMFNMSSQTQPRFGNTALAVTAAATLVFAGGMLTDPPQAVRVVLAAGLALGPALWATDQVNLLRKRNKRRMDIQGHATAASLAFLAAAIVLGLGAAIGTPLTPDNEPARWPLAYGVAGVLGWAGCAVLGNGVKIMAFLVWMHRYQPLAGIRRIPLAAELYPGQLAEGLLAMHAAGTTLLIVAALTGSLVLFHAGGALLALTATTFVGCLAGMFIPRHLAEHLESKQGDPEP